MIVFPNAKINLGLNILRKRSDGYHDIESIFYPIPLCDIFEFTMSSEVSLIQTGIVLDSDAASNLVMKAYRLICINHSLPPIKVHLHKIIPAGSGLGGGSADAAFMLIALNEFFRIGLSDEKLKEYASTLGSDCVFFINNKTAIASGRGELLQTIDLNLSGFYLILIIPPVHVSTKEAYAGVVPTERNHSLAEIIKNPLDTWKATISNDFEASILNNHDSIRLIKEQLYKHGASYASMSGSGSSVFGIFKDEPKDIILPSDYFIRKMIL